MQYCIRIGAIMDFSRLMVCESEREGDITFVPPTGSVSVDAVLL